ncbi:MAG TPA: DUF1343 domain-containing protein [Gemmatimonadales bacterium]|jgi:uncharacterized protein YbbC (DUF1343 family)|nr:DUF1343 domain-containing protein [Gemmatimonadales bacterium]
MIRFHGLVTLCVVACAPVPGRAQVRPGIEVLLADSVHLIAGKRLGLLTNHTGIDRQGRRDVDVLLANGQQPRALFSPEHGFRGAEDRPGLPDGVDSATGLPIYSLYGGSRAAARAALDSIDVLLVDLQDIGARYYTYIATATSLMRDAAQAGKRVVVLDRPDPIGGRDVQGNVRDLPANPDSVLVGFLPVPMRHGMTFGELARMANDVLGINADLVVVPAAGWKRTMLFDKTGLPWVKPSPNMPDLESALHYPGICLFEGTNVSVGRGTAFAFQVIGAPWLDADAVLSRLMQPGDWRQSRGWALAGVEVTKVVFTPRQPTDGKYDGEELWGLRVHVTDAKAYDPTRLAVALLVAIRASHPRDLKINERRFDGLAAGPSLRQAIEAGRPAWQIWATWEEDLKRFQAVRAKYLLY